MRFIDLHTHSAASDGTDSPSALVEAAFAAGLSAMAITDHDTASGVHEAQSAGERLGMEVVAGIELSTDYLGNNIHILGYFIDPDSAALAAHNQWMVDERNGRNEKMVELLREAGYDISYEELTESFPGAVLGRPHIGELLMRHGYVKSVQEAFNKFLDTNCPFYLPTRRVPIAAAAEIIRNAGGVPVLAHPYEYGYKGAELDALIDEVRAAGITHLEAYYSLHSAEQQETLLALAKSMGFGVTGGSDYHGKRKPYITIGRGRGNLAVPYELLEKLREAKNGNL